MSNCAETSAAALIEAGGMSNCSDSLGGVSRGPRGEDCRAEGCGHCHVFDSVRIKELAQFRQEFRDHKQHGLSEISHAGSFDESGISILPPVLLEHISEK